MLNDWIPQKIGATVAYNTGDTVYATDLNNIFNSLIAQGNYTADQAEVLTEESQNLQNQIDVINTATVERVGINDITPSILQTYSSNKINTLINTLVAEDDTLQEQVDKLNTNLDTTNDNVALKAPQTALDATNAIVATKATTAYVDTKTQANNLSFKESFATLALLQSAYPSGDTYNHCVLSDGMIYTYKSGWVSTQVQANGTGVANGTITPEKTNSEIPNTMNTYNLFVKSNAIIGKYIGDDGLETVNILFGYIELDILPNEYLFINSNYTSVNKYGAFFDSNNAWISRISISGNYLLKSDKQKLAIKSPSGVAKVKINFLVSDIDNILIYQDGLLVNNGTKIEDKWIDSKILRKTEEPFIHNIFSNINSNTIINYGLINTTGSILVGSGLFWCTPPIPVIEGEKYLVENWLTESYNPSDITSRGVWLDVNFVFLNAIDAIDSYSPEYIVPANAKYMILNFENALENSFSIKRLYSENANVQIRRDLIYPPINEYNSIWYGKSWVSFGDSITYHNKWQPTVISNLGLTHTNCGIGSTCIATKDCFAMDASAMWRDSRINTVKASNPLVVTIMGGANDWYQEIPIGTDAEFTKPLGSTDTITAGDTATYKNIRTFKGAYSTIIEKLLVWNPKLRIIMMATPWLYEAGYTPSETRLGIKEYSDASRDIAKYYGLPILNVDEELGVNVLTKSVMLGTGDNVHPSDYGGVRLGELVIGKFNSIPYIAL